MATVIKPCDKYNDEVKIILFYGVIKNGRFKEGLIKWIPEWKKTFIDEQKAAAAPISGASDWSGHRSRKEGAFYRWMDYEE